MYFDPLNVLSIISGVLLIVFVVIIQAVYLINMRTNDLDSNIIKVEKLIELRHDLTPLLIELYREHFSHDAELIHDVTSAREKARLLSQSSVAERDFSVLLTKLIVKASERRGKDANARLIEIEQELTELTRVIENTVVEYNQKVDKFNRKLFNPLYFMINLIKSIPRREKMIF